MNQTSTFDVIISGGGLSGLLTAIGLAEECPSLTIALVEPNEGQQSEVAAGASTSRFDDRCLALSYGSLQLLKHWNVWSLLKSNAWPIKTIVTSDRGHVGKTIMRAQDYQLNAMGYVAAMHKMGEVFQTCLAKHETHAESSSSKQITWFRPDHITSVDSTQDDVSVELQSGQHLSAKLLVVAEGGKSPTRSLLNIKVNEDQYQQGAVIANVQVKTNPQLNKVLARTDAENRPEKVTGHVAFERFTTDGPIAFLPIADDQFSVVWSINPSQRDNIMALSDEDFCLALQQAFGYGAGKITKTTEREYYPLNLIRAEQLTAHRVALVGNAAHTIHPIAGQGFNLGLRDIAVLVAQIKHAVEQQQNLGLFNVLRHYREYREMDIDRITGFTDFLVRVFAIDNRAAALTRTTALMSMQMIDSLQKWLALNFMSSKVLPGIPNIKN